MDIKGGGVACDRRDCVQWGHGKDSGSYCCPRRQTSAFHLPEVCWQIHTETSTLAYSVNTFIFRGGWGNLWSWPLGLTEAQRSAITMLELDESDLFDICMDGSGFIADIMSKYQLSKVRLFKVSIRSLRAFRKSGVVEHAVTTSDTLLGLQATLRWKLSGVTTTDISFRFPTVLNEEGDVNSQEHDNERESGHGSEVNDRRYDQDKDSIVWESDFESDTSSDTSGDSDEKWV
jgi:hypothetical protein